MNYPILWLVLLIAFAGLEGLTAGLVCIWFAFGSLAALLVAWLHVPFLAQFGVFAAVSVLAMVILRPMARRVMQPRPENTNADRIMDMEGVVMETVDNLHATGQVKFGGILWTARSADDSVIPVDARVRAVRIDGVKAIVTQTEKGAAE